MVQGALYRAAIASPTLLESVTPLEPPDFFFCLRCNYPMFSGPEPTEDLVGEALEAEMRKVDNADYRRANGVTYINGLVRLHTLLCDRCSSSAEA